MNREFGVTNWSARSGALYFSYGDVLLSESEDKLKWEDALSDSTPPVWAEAEPTDFPMPEPSAPPLSPDRGNEELADIAAESAGRSLRLLFRLGGRLALAATRRLALDRRWVQVSRDFLRLLSTTTRLGTYISPVVVLYQNFHYLEYILEAYRVLVA